MKLIVAMIQPHKLTDVKQALFQAEVYKMTVTNALGAGQQKGITKSYRGVITEVNLLNKVRIEVAVNEEFVEPTIEAIIRGGRTGPEGTIGDGKIFVLNEEGDTFVIRAGEEFELLGINRLDEFSMATPAMSGNRLLIRTKGTLYSIRNGREEERHARVKFQQLLDLIQYP